MDERLGMVERAVDFITEIAYIDFYGIGKYVCIVIPDVACDVFFGKDFPGISE